MGAESKKYMTVEEVADLLGVNYQLIYRLVRSGELPAIRLGRIYRIEQSDLDDYLQQARTAPAAGGAVCAACGKTYQSKLSVSQECVECAAPICVDCWERQGVHCCRDHRNEEK